MVKRSFRRFFVLSRLSFPNLTHYFKCLTTGKAYILAFKKHYSFVYNTLYSLKQNTISFQRKHYSFSGSMLSAQQATL